MMIKINESLLNQYFYLMVMSNLSGAFYSDARYSFIMIEKVNDHYADF